MAMHEFDQPRQDTENADEQIIERNSQGLVTRIKENTTEIRFVYLGDKLLERVQSTSIGDYELKFATSYFHKTTETGREMVLEIAGAGVNRDSKTLPINFTYAAVWIPASSDEARIGVVNENDRKVKANPVVCDAYRRECRLIQGPVTSLEAGEVTLLLGQEESALMPESYDRVSYYDPDGQEIELDLDNESDNSHKLFIEEHFPQQIPWS